MTGGVFLLEARGLDVAFGATPILRGVDLAVAHGSVCLLAGRNGAGKTTFVKALMGLVAVGGGSISLDGRDLRQERAHRRCHLGIGYMPEDRRLVPELSIEENIMLPAWATKAKDLGARLEAAYAMIPELLPLLKRPASMVSGGQQKLAALARAHVAGRRLLILDEPTEGVAPALARRLVEILATLKTGGAAVLIAESNTSGITDLADTVYAIERGTVTRQ